DKNAKFSGPKDKVKQPQPQRAAQPQRETREDFVAFFKAQGEATDENVFGQGIPQFLKRLNDAQFSAGSPLIDRLVGSGAGTAEVIEGLYLATLTRRPTAEEVGLMTAYLSRRADPEQGYAGVLWILLNSGEFVLNH